MKEQHGDNLKKEKDNRKVKSVSASSWPTIECIFGDGWKCCDTHSNTNLINKSKMNTKARVLIRWLNYFCFKHNFPTANQICTQFFYIPSLHVVNLITIAGYKMILTWVCLQESRLIHCHPFIFVPSPYYIKIFFQPCVIWRKWKWNFAKYKYLLRMGVCKEATVIY